jgi:hypothetical protein
MPGWVNGPASFFFEAQMAEKPIFRPKTPEHLVEKRFYHVVYEDSDTDLLCSCVLRLEGITWGRIILLVMSARVSGTQKRAKVLVPWKQVKRIMLVSKGKG